MMEELITLLITAYFVSAISSWSALSFAVDLVFREKPKQRRVERIKMAILAGIPILNLIGVCIVYWVLEFTEQLKHRDEEEEE